MIKFEKVSRLADVDLPLPSRATHAAAGYDFVVAEDIIVPTYMSNVMKMAMQRPYDTTTTLEELAALTKQTKAKPTLVSTGMKCELEPGYYLELSVRSSTPLKHWLILANSVGIIDADYYDNPDNEGEIFFQLINLSPYPIQLKRGDKIGQGIIKRYCITDNDAEQKKTERVGGFGSTNATIQNSLYPDGNFQRGLRAEAKVYDEALTDAICDIGFPNILPADEIRKATTEDILNAIATSWEGKI